MKKRFLSFMTALLIPMGVWAQDFSLTNPDITPAPAIFPGGSETISFNFSSGQDSYEFSDGTVTTVNRGRITFSFTKLNPTGITPSGAGADLFTWVLTNNGGTGSGLTYTYTGTTKNVTINPGEAFPAPSYPIIFANVPVTLGATQGETDIRVAGQFTPPTFHKTGTPTDDNSNNSAQIATYSQAATPVTLVSFSAKALANKTVELSWKTSSELNNKGFLVERSKDLLIFEKVGEVTDVAATSNSSHSYRILDEQPYKGTSYYRLTQLDLDGKKTVYRPQSVEIDGNYIISPNPVTKGQFSVGVDEPLLAKLALFSLDGRSVSIAHQAKGDSQIVIETGAKLVGGVYLLTVEERGQTRKYRVVVN